MSATYVALQGEDTDDNKHPDPVTAPAAGPPAAIAITITTPITPRRITRRPITNRGNPASPPRSLGAARRRARSSWGARTPSCGSRAACAAGTSRPRTRRRSSSRWRGGGGDGDALRGRARRRHAGARGWRDERRDGGAHPRRVGSFVRRRGRGGGDGVRAVTKTT